MMANLKLKKLILEVVENQLRDDDPPVTRQVYQGLLDAGYSVSEAKETYEENDIDYEIKSYEESVVLISECEIITIEYHESEVLI